MASVWRHKEAYLAEERRLVERFSSETTATREHSEKLFDEFDVFAVQIKSTLDHLTKVMRPILGRNKWTLGTFGDKGERVLMSLQRNTGKHYAGRVRSMEFLLFNDHHKAWLTAIIDTRDRVNHHLEGGVKIDNFAVFRRPDGSVSVPMWSEEQELGKDLLQDMARVQEMRRNNVISLNEVTRRKEREQQEKRLAALQGLAGAGVARSLADDGLQSNERKLSLDLAAEKSRDTAKDVLLDESIHIMADAAALSGSGKARTTKAP
jgi:hypothetical protein